MVAVFILLILARFEIRVEGSLVLQPSSEYPSNSHYQVSSTPKYEEHHSLTVPQMATLKFVTFTSTTSRIHTIRHTSTSDVWVTSALIFPVSLTQYETRRSFRNEDPATVTSLIRVTKTPIQIETQTIEKNPVRTLVSRFTEFETITSTVNLWQPIVHFNTSFEVISMPVSQTQLLLQVIHSTMTTRSTKYITSARKFGY